MSEIDVTPLKRAVQRLEEGFAIFRAEPVNMLCRDGLLQRFKFTYELAHATLRRALKAVTTDSSEIATSSFQRLIQIGNDQGLVISPWPMWREFRQARVDTSQTYDEEVLSAVVSMLPAFLAEVREMICAIERRVAFV